MSARGLIVLFVGLVLFLFAGIAATDSAYGALPDPSNTTEDFATLFGTAYGDVGGLLPLALVVAMGFAAILVLGRAR